MKRRTFIAGGLGALGLLAGGIFWAKGTLYRKAANSMRQLTGDLDAQFLRQVITADSAHSRMLMWQAESPLVNPGIEYRLKGQEDARIVAAKQDFFTDDGVENNQYTAELTDLTADTEYEYRVAAEGAAGA
ncbi:MAG: fibronectin type III domain-containing protein, partial [Selenomonas sp.]|nr:fibronectin type III domain-containing protein [Selenomonas sp.]